MSAEASQDQRGGALVADPGRRLRVVVLSDHLGRRNGGIHGVTTWFLETLPAFDRARIDPSLYILQPWHPVAERFEALGVPLRCFGRAKSDPRSLVDVLGFLGRENVDVLHLCGLKSLLIGRVAARLKGCPTVAHFHDTIPSPGWMRGLQRRLAPWTAAAIAVSHSVRDWTIEEYALPPERIEVVYNGHVIEPFVTPAEGARKRIRAELGLEERPVIGVIGRIDHNKGQQSLISALPRLLERCPEAMLLVIGEGSERGACEALVRRKGLATAVRFTGFRQDVPELLAAIDVVALPSLSEGFPFVAIEAAAAGRPLVAFRTGGVPELVRHETTGLLVPPGDVAGLVDGLARVLHDANLRHRLGEQGQRHVEQFAVSRHVRHLEALYARIARPRAAAPVAPRSRRSLAHILELGRRWPKYMSW